MTVLGFLMPPWVRALAVALSYAIVASGSAYIAWNLKAVSALKKEIAAVKIELVVEKAQAAVSNKVADATLTKGKAVKKTYEKINEEVKAYDDHRAAAGLAPVYPTADAGTGLRVPTRFVCVWNAANQGLVPDPLCISDASESGTGLGAIEAQHIREAEIAKQLTNDLFGLQRWVCAQALLHNGELPDFEVCRLPEGDAP